MILTLFQGKHLERTSFFRRMLIFCTYIHGYNKVMIGYN